MGDILEDLFAQLNQNIISLTGSIGKISNMTETIKAEISNIHVCGCEQGRKEYLGSDNKQKKDYKSIVALIAAGGLILKDVTQGLYEFIIKLLSTHRV